MSMQPYGTSTPQPYAPTGRVATDQRTNTLEVVFAWGLTLVSLGYLLPWAIAASRGKSNSAAIALLNVLAGWTVIGWIASLVMACGAHQVAPGAVVVTQMNAVAVQTPPAWYPDPSGSGQRYWDGQRWTDHTQP